MAHQLPEVFQQRLHLHRMRVQGLFARERQQALGQQRPALGGFQRPADTRRVRRIRVYQLQAADNHRQQVVKIVRQPAGQLPNGLHLLAVQQRLFQPLPLKAIDLHLRGLLFQQSGGVLQRGGIAGKDVKCPRQLAQLIPPLQRRHRHILFAVGQPRHRPGDRRQVGAQIAVDIPAGTGGNDQCQYGKHRDKDAD
ncbi:hypothetical protein D3C75_405400 [compost metagenome]